MNIFEALRLGYQVNSPKLNAISRKTMQDYGTAEMLKRQRADPNSEQFDPASEALHAGEFSPDDLVGSGLPSRLAKAIAGAVKFAGPKIAAVAPVLSGIMKERGGNWVPSQDPVRITRQLTAADNEHPEAQIGRAHV